MKKIHKICELVANISDEEIAEAEKITSDQKNYVHPLKNEKAARLHKIGQANEKILAAFKAFRTTILQYGA